MTKILTMFNSDAEYAKEVTRLSASKAVAATPIDKRTATEQLKKVRADWERFDKAEDAVAQALAMTEQSGKLDDLAVECGYDDFNQMAKAHGYSPTAAPVAAPAKKTTRKPSKVDKTPKVYTHLLKAEKNNGVRDLTKGHNGR